ncbi:helix-turn-helix transcriptional regulator [Runella sp. MFBS21]|uniref:helix-turn-helix domain-containing protein n=1 Tax=Runella sp. MFBS21 TaxID=3034018 RepID=UPI0023F89F92|nr:helix-turn-helix transcriptional regulator [Runella sp. MFBS21]MDF7822311.1 helix-turn-helix transcriptional regulator [Runella sp. MFBS21]
MEVPENQRIEILRKFLKMSQTEFAKSIGMSQSNYNMAIRDGRNISGKPIYLLQSVHKVDLDWIFGQIESETPVFVEESKEEERVRQLEQELLKTTQELLKYKSQENEELKRKSAQSNG